MIRLINKRKDTVPFKILSFFTSFTFLISLLSPTIVQAQMIGAVNLPTPGSMVLTSPAYMPPLLSGMIIHPENSLAFDFIVTTGDAKIEGEELKKEGTKLIKYFLASMTVPDEDMWVNLSPYEKDRIIPDALGSTELGRDLLSEDYILKQLTASLIYPENELGKRFWDRVYKKVYEKYGKTDIPVNTFNKVWIIPNKAVVHEYKTGVFVKESSLKVMLEEDYLTLKNSRKEGKFGTDKIERKDVEALSGISSQIVREIILPEIEKEVNNGKNFAQLRQIYNSMILASWYKGRLMESLLGKIYADKNKVSGIDIDDKNVKETIYNQYMEAFKKGAYNYIKEDFDLASKETVSRQYASGGFTSKTEDGSDLHMKVVKDAVQANSVGDVIGDLTMKGNIHNFRTDLTAPGEKLPDPAMTRREFLGTATVAGLGVLAITETGIAGEIKKYFLDTGAGEQAGTLLEAFATKGALLSAADKTSEEKIATIVHVINDIWGLKPPSARRMSSETLPRYMNVNDFPITKKEATSEVFAYAVAVYAKALGFTVQIMKFDGKDEYIPILTNTQGNSYLVQTFGQIIISEPFKLAEAFTSETKYETTPGVDLSIPEKTVISGQITTTTKPALAKPILGIKEIKILKKNPGVILFEDRTYTETTPTGTRTTTILQSAYNDEIGTLVAVPLKNIGQELADFNQEISAVFDAQTALGVQMKAINKATSRDEQIKLMTESLTALQNLQEKVSALKKQFDKNKELQSRLPNHQQNITGLLETLEQNINIIKSNLEGSQPKETRTPDGKTTQSPTGQYTIEGKIQIGDITVPYRVNAGTEAEVRKLAKAKQDFGQGLVNELNIILELHNKQTINTADTIAKLNTLLADAKYRNNPEFKQPFMDVVSPYIRKLKGEKDKTTQKAPSQGQRQVTAEGEMQFGDGLTVKYSATGASEAEAAKIIKAKEDFGRGLVKDLNAAIKLYKSGDVQTAKAKLNILNDINHYKDHPEFETFRDIVQGYLNDFSLQDSTNQIEKYLYASMIPQALEQMPGEEAQATAAKLAAAQQTQALERRPGQSMGRGEFFATLLGRGEKKEDTGDATMAALFEDMPNARANLEKIHDVIGQSPWIDFIGDPEIIEEAKNGGMRGLTSNPALIEGAIKRGDYKGLIEELDDDDKNPNITDKEILRSITIKAVQDACDIFNDVYVESKGQDGFVSLEIDPSLADDANASIKEAIALVKDVGRENLMIKVPATVAGYQVIEALIAQGINVNVTLIFTLEQYRAQRKAYERGIKKFMAEADSANKQKPKPQSVASVFVRRIEDAVRLKLESKLGSLTSPATDADKTRIDPWLIPDGRIAIANAAQFYADYQAWKEKDALIAQGITPQRVLWASTGAKASTPADTFVSSLFAKGTVNTMPPATADAVAQMAESDIKTALQTGKEIDSAKIISDLETLKDIPGLEDLDIVKMSEQLILDGVASFKKSNDGSLAAIRTIREKPQTPNSQMKVVGQIEEEINRTQREAATTYWDAYLERKPSPVGKLDPKEWEIAQEQHYTKLEDVFNTQTGKGYLREGFQTVLNGKGKITFLLAGEASRMNPKEAWEELPEDIRQLIEKIENPVEKEKKKDILSKAAVSLGQPADSPVIYNYLSFQLLNIFALFREVEELANTMGLDGSKVWNNEIVLFTSAQYEQEHLSIIDELRKKMAEKNIRGFDKLLVKMKAYHQPKRQKIYATPQDIQKLESKYPSEKAYQAARAFAEKIAKDYDQTKNPSVLLSDEKGVGGHGEVWTEQIISDILLDMFEENIEWGYLRNIDNNQGKYDQRWLTLLGMQQTKQNEDGTKGLDFLAEVSQRSIGQKGGVPVRHKTKGNKVLIEDATVEASNLGVSVNAPVINNAAGFYSRRFAAAIFKAEGQSDEGFFKDLKAAQNDQDLKRSIYDRGRERFLLLMDPKPGKDPITDSNGVSFKPAMIMNEINLWNAMLFVNKIYPQFNMDCIWVQGVVGFPIDEFISLPNTTPDGRLNKRKLELFLQQRFAGTKQYDLPWRQQRALIQKMKIALNLRKSEKLGLTKEEIRLRFESFKGNRPLNDFALDWLTMTLNGQHSILGNDVAPYQPDDAAMETNVFNDWFEATVEISRLLNKGSLPSDGITATFEISGQEGPVKLKNVKLINGTGNDAMSALDAIWISGETSDKMSKSVKILASEFKNMRIDRAMAKKEELDRYKRGGIDLNRANLNMQIKRDGNGVPLPLDMQNVQMINIEGLTPNIINIIPITPATLPLLLGENPMPMEEPQKISMITPE